MRHSIRGPARRRYTRLRLDKLAAIVPPQALIHGIGRQGRRLEQDRGDPDGGRLASEGRKDALWQFHGGARARRTNDSTRRASHPMLQSMRPSVRVRLQIVVCVRSLSMLRLSGIGRGIDVDDGAGQELEVVQELVLDLLRDLVRGIDCQLRPH